MRVIRYRSRRFKRGDIVKQDNGWGGFDFFHVESECVLPNGNQVLEAIADSSGIRCGLASDFSLPATLQELVEARDKRRQR